MGARMKKAKDGAIVRDGQIRGSVQSLVVKNRPGRGWSGRSLSYCLLSTAAALALFLVAGGCDSGQVVKPPVPPTISYPRIDTAWDVSPKDQSVLYTRAVYQGQPGGNYLIDTTAGAAPTFFMPLDLQGVGPYSFRFSPDGLSVAFDHNLDIWIRNLVDSTARQVTFTYGNAEWPDWDPSGTQIVYVRPFLSPGAPDTSSGLFILDLLTLQDRHLRHNGLPTYGGHPRWSPDGQWITFTYGSPSHVYRINIDGSGYLNLTPNAAWACENPVWIDGGTRIVFEFFNRQDRSQHQTRVVNADGSGLGTYPVSLRPYGVQSALSRDGGFVVYDSLDAAANVLVLFLKPASAASASNLRYPRQLTTYLPLSSAIPTAHLGEPTP